MDEHKVVFQGELQLTAWGDSSTTGPWVKFWCHPEDLEQFKLFRMRKGNKEAGTRLGTVMVEIGEDEAVVTQTDPPAATPAPSPAPRRYHPPHIGALGMLSVRWCKDSRFWEWADAQGFNAVKNEAQAKEFILGMCGLTIKHGAAASRKHLDTDAEAAHLFQERIRYPFMEWQRENAQQE